MLRRRNAPEPIARPLNCLNCGVAVPPENIYCGQCGQENEPSPVTFAALLHEAWEEFVKIDSQLLKTLALLVFRPGFLSIEYVRGRRTAYLSPFRMYVGVSALFFFVFGFLVPFDRIDGWENRADALEHKVEVAVQKKHAAKNFGPATPKTTPVSLTVGPNGGMPSVKVGPNDNADEEFINNWKKVRHRPITVLGYPILMDTLPENVSEYRDAQEQLPRTKRDNPVLHYAKERLIHFKSEPGDTAKLLFSTALPLMLLVQLPLAAIWLRILYFRQKRLYVEHLVFLLHTHTLYLLLLGLILAPEVMMRSMGGHWTLFGNPLVCLFLIAVIVWHNLIAMRRFYGQSWGKTLVKSWLFGNGYSTLLLFTMIISLGAAICWTMLMPG